MEIILILAIALVLLSLLYMAITTVEKLLLNKYIITYNKPSESTLVSFYRTIKTYNKASAKAKLYKEVGGCYILEVELVK